MVDNERFPYAQGFQAGLRHVRCLSLWCRALKPAIESYAKTLEAVITNILSARRSERQARLSGSDLPGFFDKEKLEDNL